MASIRRRLRIDHEYALGRERMDIGLAAQAAMLMYLGAACVFFATFFVPLGERTDTTACCVLGVLSLIAAATWFCVFDRAPIWLVYVGTLYGTGIIAAGLHYTGTARTESVALLLWGIVYAFVFFQRRLAVAYLALVCAADALVLHVGDRSFSWIGYWLTSASSLAAVGLVVGALRERLMGALERSEERAQTDELTGLANRRQLMIDLERTCACGEPHLLVLFDLNGFKRFNDERGHVEGDALLRRLGARLLNVLRDDGRAYRLGGDEFCLLLRGDGERVTPRAVRALSESSGDLRVTAAHGFVSIPAEATNPIDALRTADRRMYDDKYLAHRLLPTLAASG